MLNIRRRIIGLLALLWSGMVLAQAPDPVLFSVQGRQVPVSEFRNAYLRTAGEQPDFSRASLEQALERYIAVVLKVQYAHDLRFDTLSKIREELELNRRQLAASYLVDTEVTEPLLKEAYTRMQQDVEMAHIFFACKADAEPADTLRAWRRAVACQKLLAAGTPFEVVAADSSDDKTAKEAKGYLGFVTAMLPSGFYSMENAVYTAKTGQITGPIRTTQGYHLIRVLGTRPARGQIELAHIFVSTKDLPVGDPRAKNRIDSVWNLLRGGANWETVCARHSEDKVSAPKAGYIGVTGINRFQKEFEAAAFALSKDGDFSAPVQTTLGWHIIRRISKKPLGTLDELRTGLSDKIKRDERSEVRRQQLLRRIQTEAKFKEYPAVLEQWMARQTDELFHSFAWKPDPSLPQTPLLELGTAQTGTLADFEQFALRASRERMQGRGFPIPMTVSRLYQAWKEACVFKYEETRLSKQNSDFRLRTREFEDIALLYEVAKMEVWDKAASDTAGLLVFFRDSLSRDWRWEERAEVSVFTVFSDDMNTILNVRSVAARKPAELVLAQFNTGGQNLVRHEIRRYEKGQQADIDAVWKPGALTIVKSETKKAATFMKIESLLPAGPKTLEESRGSAISAYQACLERNWVARLRTQYKVVVNTAALRGMERK